MRRLGDGAVRGTARRDARATRRDAATRDRYGTRSARARRSRRCAGAGAAQEGAMKTRDGANTAVVTRERYVLDGALDEGALRAHGVDARTIRVTLNTEAHGKIGAKVRGDGDVRGAGRARGETRAGRARRRVEFSARRRANRRRGRRGGRKGRRRRGASRRGSDGDGADEAAAIDCRRRRWNTTSRRRACRWGACCGIRWRSW